MSSKWGDATTTALAKQWRWSNHQPPPPPPPPPPPEKPPPLLPLDEEGLVAAAATAAVMALPSPAAVAPSDDVFQAEP